MTRKSAVALVTLLVGLLSLASVTPVSAARSCTGYAQEHCEQIAAAEEGTRFSAVIAPSAVHVLGGNGMGQEHFEAMMAGNVRLFAVAAPATTESVLPRYAQEHFEEIMAARTTSN